MKTVKGSEFERFNLTIRKPLSVSRDEISDASQEHYCDSYFLSAGALFLNTTFISRRQCSPSATSSHSTCGEK